MADLKIIEKAILEKYFEMGGGYVCNFSNRTFSEFILENAGIDIYKVDYAGSGSSKASRFRALWEIESNHLVANLLSEMLEYWKIQKHTLLHDYRPFDPILYEECKKIIDRLKNTSSIKNIDALTPNSNERDFGLLAQSIKESIEKNQPEHALDRLHTFVIRYMRVICDCHGIPFTIDTPLHSLFGSYVKFLQTKYLLESEMSERILKSSISVLEAFNTVRNKQSLAHPNKVLNYNESVLIFNNISNTIRFIKLMEQRLSEQQKKSEKEEINWGDLEFSEEEIEAAGDAWVQNEIDRMRGK